MMQQRTLPMEVLMERISELLNSGNAVQLKARGYSMLPFIRHETDSMEMVSPLPVSVGDIVLAHLPEGRYVAHRVIGLEGDSVTLKGDGNLDRREYCHTGDIVATVTGIVQPSGRTINCRSKFFLLISRIWRSLPRILRRLFLAVIRRLPSHRRHSFSK